MTPILDTPLHRHILCQDDYYAVYERYTPDEARLVQLAALGIPAQVRIYYSLACGECARHLPALARIAEHLPGWSWQLILDDEASLQAAHCTLTTPIITVSDADDRLLGAINGNPIHGSLEADLLHIVSTAREETTRALHSTA